MQLTRKPKDKNKILGSGHRIFDMGLKNALAIEGVVAASSGVSFDYLFFTVFDQVTDAAKEKGVRTYVCEVGQEGLKRVLVDWEALKILNEVSPSSSVQPERNIPSSIIETCERAVLDIVKSDDFAPKVPVASLCAAILHG